MTLNPSQLNTILAALRVYQALGLFDDARRGKDIDDIATNGGTETPLDDQGIEELVNGINNAPDGWVLRYVCPKTGCYYADDGTLMNADGTRSIFDDVDQ